MRIAVCIPCHNEAAAIAAVVQDFRQSLPQATIYVYDNASTDDTMTVARAAGAVVRQEPQKGKGNVVRRMFADIEADIYILVDGDDTYDASKAPAMVQELVAGNADMVTGTRIDTSVAAYRPGHRFGNAALTGIVKLLFGDRITDMLSGYRVLSRRFVKSFPILSSGFEIETELTIHALELRMALAEVETPYSERGEGSTSKLRTYHDGVRILSTIVDLLGRERPLWFFGGIAGLVLLLSAGLGLPVFLDYLDTGLVERFPTAILCMILVVVSLLSMTCGLILRMTTIARREIKRLAYLREPSVAAVAADMDSTEITSWMASPRTAAPSLSSV